MTTPTEVPAGRALIVSDSPIARDPRVLRQIGWLTESGWSVDTLGRGAKPAEVNGDHFPLPRRPAIVRILAYLFLPNPLKYRLLIEDTIPSALRGGITGSSYDLVVLNEIELLPWFAKTRDRLLKPEGRAHLDLHENAPSQRTGLAYRLIFKRFRDWMIGFIPSPTIDSRSTVAAGIGRLYVERFGFTAPSVIRSCPSYVDQEPSPVDPARIRLIHHGAASLSRGLELMVAAMTLADERFTLDLMLFGSEDVLATLKRQATPLGDRVQFRDPVDVREIPTIINEYDLEVIFFPPVTENLRYALPNKFFEAVQGRLGVVIGRSSEMVELVDQYGIGAIAQGWESSQLADALNGLSGDAIAEMKANSAAAAHDLSSETEGARFFAALSVTG